VFVVLVVVQQFCQSLLGAVARGGLNAIPSAIHSDKND
jgi:hypothetical protein